jgi:uncharacterized membrane protein
MRARIGKATAALRDNFWFLPAVMTVAAALLALLLSHQGHAVEVGLLSEMLKLTAQGVRDLLGMIASSMITVATTAFSIIIVALQLASGQLGPRLLRNFIRDRGNQLVFGTFLGAFVYCLVLLPQVGTAGGGRVVPDVAVLGAVALTVAGVGVLIYFIHHAAQSIQKDHVIARVSNELVLSLDKLYPKTIGIEPPVVRSDSGGRVQRLPKAALQAWDDGQDVLSSRSGYIQAIDAVRLMRLTTRLDLQVTLHRRPGDFVPLSSALARVRPKSRVSPELAVALEEVVVLGRERTAQQDVGFVFDQLVEIALRALSPGVTDLFTAMRCIDRLADALAMVARTAIPSPYRFDIDGELRVITQPLNFVVLLRQVFYPIGEAAMGKGIVVKRLYAAVEEIAPSCGEERERRELEAFRRYLQRLSESRTDPAREEMG